MKKIFCSIVIIGGLLLANSCSDNLEIKNDYDFTVTHLPVPKRLKTGETAEIRFELNRSGIYANAKYYVRYFQFDGEGTLTLDGQVLSPNDSYELKTLGTTPKCKSETFRMYYTSQSEEQQVIELTFYDTFRNQVVLTFSFAHQAVREENQENH